MTQQKLSSYFVIAGLLILAACWPFIDTKEYALAVYPMGLFFYSGFLAVVAFLWKEYKYLEIKWYMCMALGFASGAFTSFMTYVVTGSAPMALIFLVTFTVFIYTFVIGATLINVSAGDRNFTGYSERIARCFPLVAIMAPTGFFINAGAGLVIGSLGVICLWSLRDKAEHVMRNMVLLKNEHRVEEEYMRWQGSCIVSCVSTIASILLFVVVGAAERELVSNDYVIATLVAVAMFWVIITNMLRMNKLIDENKHMFA